MLPSFAPQCDEMHPLSSAFRCIKDDKHTGLHETYNVDEVNMYWDNGPDCIHNPRYNETTSPKESS